MAILTAYTILGLVALGLIGAFIFLLVYCGVYLVIYHIISKILLSLRRKERKMRWEDERNQNKRSER